MGIIEKQATRTVIYSYLGAVLGFFTVMWFSRTLTTDENGLVRLLVSTATLLAQIASLGFSAVTTRLFPYFRNHEKGHHGFLFYAIIVSTIGFILCWIGFYFFKPLIIESNSEKSKLFVDYLFYLMPLSFFLLFFGVFDTYLRACYSSVIGSVTKDFIQRVIILGILALYYFQFISFSLFILGYIMAVCLPTVVLWLYIVKLKEWHVKPVRGFMTKELANQMVRISLFSLFAGFSGAIVLNIDSIMVNQMLGLSETGIYTIAFFFGSMMLIPMRSINRITSSIVAEAMKDGNMAEIHKLYKQTCNTGMAIAFVLFVGICINIDNIMQLLPQEYASGKSVILFISAGYITEMATGINSVILTNSRYYYYDAYFIVIIVLTTILSNYFLIPIYGITGSAVATALTVTVGNFIRWLFLFVKLGMQPYDFNSIKLAGITIIMATVGYFTPKCDNFIIDIVVRSSVAGVSFIILILKTEASPDINSKIRKNLNYIWNLRK